MAAAEDQVGPAGAVHKDTIATIRGVEQDVMRA